MINVNYNEKGHIEGLYGIVKIKDLRKYGLIQASLKEYGRWDQ